MVSRWLVCMLLLWSGISLGQQLNGTVTAADTGLPLPDSQVYLSHDSSYQLTDEQGEFSLETDHTGLTTLTIFYPGYNVHEQELTLPISAPLDIALKTLSTDLDEVVILAQQRRISQLRNLRPVEGTAIYSARKSEVIELNGLPANLATANARQVYAQVAGLNIYENDDAGLQLNVGGRGLDPNRTAHYNVRQNGYNISADALGYPESYYSPPAEAIDRIELVRGAASLQYGTQFGGLLNFKLRQPRRDRKFGLDTRQTLASNGLFTSFNAVDGQVNKLGYYAHYNYKKGDGFRPNSDFESHNAYVHLDYQLAPRTTLTYQLTFLDYLAQQPGGLTDAQFATDAFQSNRTRNFFKVDWLMNALLLDHEFNDRTKGSLQVFNLDASRKSVGFRENRVSQEDDLSAPRELLVGEFNNWGAEARILSNYTWNENKNTYLIGARYYQANNAERQGAGSNGTDADFRFRESEFPAFPRQSDFEFPNLNLALFGEHIFNFGKWSVTPGARLEFIKTESQGTYRQLNFDLAGNVILDETIPDNRTVDRTFGIFGVGVGYRASRTFEAYANLTQNYRSVTFNDIRVTNPSLSVDPDIKDERGFTADLGVRGRAWDVLRYDTNVFLLNYSDRIGVINREVSDIQQERFRGNIGDAITYGVEGLLDWNLWKTLDGNEKGLLDLFTSFAFTGSEYTSSDQNNVEGNEVEFIPSVNLKAGVRFGYKDLLGSLQLTHLSRQFTDATNSPSNPASQSGILGEIPAYTIMDFSLSYTYKQLTLSAGVNNLLDETYFTRRATGYPGPGILPSAPRQGYLTLGYRL